LGRLAGTKGKAEEIQAFSVLSSFCRACTFLYKGALMGLLLHEQEKEIRILVVDDHPSVRRYLRRALEQQEHWRVCDEARDGQDAVDRFWKIRPDVIVLDFQMPAMNGLDAARILTQLSPETPILIVTLYLSKQLSDEAKKVGARGACVKTDTVSMVNAVGALLRHETYFPQVSPN
jgi:DNA-binding NarL/FixJ family response regulator